MILGGMTEEFWAQRWREGQIGFHEGRPNSFLERHLDVLGSARRVLVPLCGKAEDLAFLASRGHEVVGVELVQAAVEAFFAEHGVKPELSRRGAFTRYVSGSLTVLSGDFFALTAEDAGAINALYDRAALIALPPELRGPYVAKLRALLPKASPGLIVTLEYPQELRAGPPFSVLEPELRSHYAGCELELLDDQSWASRGAPPVEGRERCFRVRL
jgi:thiopurine S-methyltransferase